MTGFIYRAIICAWAMAILTAIPALWLYSVSDPEFQGISICMFGNIGQGNQVKIFKITLFVITYLIPGFVLTSGFNFKYMKVV